MGETPRFTVFTPTYNRADSLHRPYDSLRHQTFRDFEWLIVDDGSTDGTADLVARWAQDGDVQIRYIRQEHAGLGAAFNRGVQEARATLFLELDSDDECRLTSLEVFARLWDGIPANQRDRFCSVTVLCSDVDGAVVGDRFPVDVFDSDYLEIRYRYRLGSEKWGCHRRDVLARFPFPELPPGQTYATHGVIWGPIARAGYKIRYANEPLLTYYADRSDNMSQERAEAVAFSRRVYHHAALTEDLRWFRVSPLAFIKSALQYARFSFHSGIGVVGQIRDLGLWGSRLLWAVALPAGYLLARRDRR